MQGNIWVSKFSKFSRHSCDVMTDSSCSYLALWKWGSVMCLLLPLCIFLSWGRARHGRLQFCVCSSCLLPHILTILASWMLSNFLVSSDVWNCGEISCSTMCKNCDLASSLTIVTNSALENCAWRYIGFSFGLATMVCHFLPLWHYACRLCWY